MATRQLNIKNRSYYFYNDLFNILNFEVNTLKLLKKSPLGLDIYYIGYADKNPDSNVNSVNPLNLMMNRVYRRVSEKNGNKYLTIDKNDDVLKNMIKCLLVLNIISTKLMAVKLFIKKTT